MAPAIEQKAPVKAASAGKGYNTLQAWIRTVKHQKLKEEIRDVEIIRRYTESVERTLTPPKSYGKPN
ncbi:MAG: hypothetical protein FWF95_07270 [Syntrophorhabdaceae bacterium]|nr:hypothetical protein [Syntrophorhabdaceae bacterium]